eukprot:sb/3473225/
MDLSLSISISLSLSLSLSLPPPDNQGGGNNHTQLSEFLLLNARGINPTFLAQRHKAQQIAEWMRVSGKNVPFLTITETHLNSTIFDVEVEMEGYSVFRADRVRRKHGGVAIYVRNDLAVSSRDTYSSSFCEASMVMIDSANPVSASWFITWMMY